MKQEKPVPKSRLSRLSKIGGLVAKVATNTMIDGAKQWSKGQSPSLKDLLLQPKNIENLADKLAQLRGAAMKIGQLLSMDAGDLLPQELSILLDRLRDKAQPMPYKQLVETLKSEWGEGWLLEFSHFDLKPFASASIGQVHKAHLANGQKLAVKVQYPGVRDAISSDVDNVATLLKMSELVPPQIELENLLKEAKRQLLTEADYQQEAKFIQSYARHIDQNKFVLPMVKTELSTSQILVMDYVDGVPIDTLTNASQALRDEVVSNLIELFFQELFVFKLMQTDPNFANFLYQAESNRTVLLDFGATRKIPDELSQGYLSLMGATMAQDREKMIEAAQQIGFFQSDISDDYLDQILKVFVLANEPMMTEGKFDFAGSDLVSRIKQQGMELERQSDQWHTPPVDAIFIHRKLAGMFLLGARLKAKVNVRELFEKVISG